MTTHTTPHTEAPDVAATDSKDNQLLRDVMDRHGVTTDRLAIDANLSESYVNRMRNGHYPVSSNVLRILYRATRDQSIIDYLTACDEMMSVPIGTLNRDEMLKAMMWLSSDIATGGMGPLDHDKHTRLVQSTIRQLAAYWSSLNKSDDHQQQEASA